MDERLEAGRQHLANADAAIGRGDWRDGRAYFEAALLQFRGPELRIGEAHALRGLASVELGDGAPALAETRLREAVRAYRDVRSMLDALDDAGIAAALRTDALEGEAVAQVLLGEMLLRTGRDAEAQEARDWARQAYDAVGARPSEAGLWALTGRLAMRDGDQEEAGLAYSRALAVHERSGDTRGQATVLRAMAEVARLEGDIDAARRYLERAQDLARQLGDIGLEARILAGIGSVARQTGDIAGATTAYREVLGLASRAGDREILGFAHLNLGELESRAGDADALDELREAVRILGAIGVHHGVGAALHHASAHALQSGCPDHALAMAEGARRLWRGMDPVRGVGQAMRLQVKALAAMKEWRGVLAVAQARAALVGDSQPNSAEVLAFYRSRAPAEWTAELDRMTPMELFMAAEEAVEAALLPLLSRLRLQVSGLGSVSDALQLLDAFRTARGEADLMEVPADALEELPPEEEFYVIVDDPHGDFLAVPGPEEFEEGVMLDQTDHGDP